MRPLLYSFFGLSFTLMACSSAESYERALSACDKLLQQGTSEPENPGALLEIECLKGAQMPDFELSTLDGRTIGKSYFNDSVAVIHFWHIVCPPCIAEIQGLNVVAGTFKEKPVQFLSVSRDMASQTEQFLTQYTWHFDHAINGLSVIQDVFHLRWELPVTLVIDPDGRIVYALRGGKPDDRAITEIQDHLIPVIRSTLEAHRM